MHLPATRYGLAVRGYFPQNRPMISGFQKTIRVVICSIAVVALLSCAPSYNESVPQQHRQAGENTVSAYDNMARPRGLKTDVILTKDLEALVGETQVIQSQINRLVAKLEDLQAKILSYNARPHNVETVAEIPPVSIIPPTQKPVLQTPVPQKKSVVPTPKVEKPRGPETTPVAATGKGVVGLRFGAHADKTRLVLDINGSTRHTHDFDKEVGILTVTLPETAWHTDTAKSYNFAQVSGYQAKPVDGGTVIALSVKNTSAVKTSTIGGSVTRPARLVIDLIK